MKARLLLVITAALYGTLARGQVRITSFKSDGVLTWTNSAKVGVYRVEWADAPIGPWKSFSTATNLNSIWVQTNRVEVGVPISIGPAFYRVVWSPPDPVGTWDCRGYDSRGSLVFAGVLKVNQATNSSSTYAGLRDFKYAGPPTNNLFWLGRLLGSGPVQGSLNVTYSQFRTGVLPIIYDDYNDLSGTVWANTFTGYWSHSTIAQTFWGPFEAVKP